MRYLAIAAAALLGSAAHAQQATDLARQSKVDLKNWSTAELENGWTTDRLYDATIYGAGGEELGGAEITNIFMDRDGQITRFLVDVGGFLGIGDSFISVPFSKVNLGKDREGITLPVTAENAEDYGLFVDDQDRQQGVYRAYDLVGDYVRLENDVGYGIVQDLVFNDNGRLDAILVTADMGYDRPGTYAYPYYAPYEYGYDLYDPYYNLPYAESEVEDLEPFAMEEDS